MSTYIFHNETRSELVYKKLSSYPNGEVFREVIKDNTWWKSDIICAISNNDMSALVYANDIIVVCEDISHLEKLENTLDKLELDNLNEVESVNDCGCPSEVESCEVESEYESENECEDNEEEIWALRRKMVGLKNITKERIYEVRDGYFKLSGKGTSNNLRIELGMDIIKYLWKMVIMEFTTIEHFKELCDEIFEFIEKRLRYVESYMKIEYENFRQDILRVTCIEN